MDGMHITLMRHGKPIFAPGGWLAPVELGSWIARYDQSDVLTSPIPADSIAAARNAALVLTSTLPRARASALALGHAAGRSDALFREAPLPFPLWRYPRLSPALWIVLLRLSWLCGYARGADSVAAVRRRAQAASAQLIACAANGPVLLIGHGIMNHMIARELRAAGWRAASPHRSGYWATTRFASA
jgi:broad specificity phosphatase PhoE